MSYNTSAATRPPGHTYYTMDIEYDWGPSRRHKHTYWDDVKHWVRTHRGSLLDNPSRPSATSGPGLLLAASQHLLATNLCRPWLLTHEPAPRHPLNLSAFGTWLQVKRHPCITASVCVVLAVLLLIVAPVCGTGHCGGGKKGGGGGSPVRGALR